MASLAQASRNPIIATTEISTESLVEWRKEYLALDDATFDSQSSPLQAILADQIDAPYFEHLISQALLTTSVSRGFCNRCLDLFSHWPNLGTKCWSHGIGKCYSSAEIEAATRQGCKSCFFFFEKLKATQSLEDFRKIEQRLHILNENYPIALSIQNWGDGGETFLLWLNYPGKLAKHCNDRSAGIRFESHVVPLPFYTEVWTDHFELLKDWLSICSKSHSSCYNKADIERPSRLVRIKGGDIRLVLTANWGEMAPYATLSYCWGTSDFLKLTKDTLKPFFDTLPRNSLPQMFRDAILIAQRAGLEYLWIDALCIIQSEEDKTDWIHESALMRSIYGGSHLNIAATSSTSVYEGCLPKRPNSGTGFLARIQTESYCRVHSFHSSSVYEEATRDSHLATRAWAFQERLLAPRTVYVNENGLFWECRSTIASDSLPKGFPGILGDRLVRSPQDSWGWGDIIFHYSRANLTHAADKLPALSGIARRQHEVTGDEYLAGMWKKRFVKQLGWQSIQKVARPDWRAPTWSWLSVDGEVACWGSDDLAKTEYVQVISADVTLAGSDPFGQISHGKLQLSCTALCRGEYHKLLTEPEAQHCDQFAFETSHLLIPISFDCSEGNSIGVGSHLYILPLFEGRSGSGWCSPAGKDTSDSAEPCTFSEQSSGESSEDKWRHVDQLMIRGIILQSIDLSQGYFKRVGSLDICTEPDEEGVEARSTETYTGFRRMIETLDKFSLDFQHVQHLTNYDNSSSSLRFNISIF